MRVASTLGVRASLKALRAYYTIVSCFALILLLFAIIANMGFLNKLFGGGPKPIKPPAVLGESANKARGRAQRYDCLLYTSPSPRDRQKSRMPSSA